MKTRSEYIDKPLKGVKILDLTHAYSGPFCTMHLADQGAEVWKLEAPGKGDQSRNWAPFINGSSGYYAYINRNKLGITLDLKSDEGKEIFKELITKVDVVVENFRVGTMEKLGLGYEVLKEINPGLIYASISGFGRKGELAGQPCYDIIAQAMGGLMSITGFGDTYTKVGTSIADNYSGTYLALGIAMALYQKEKTGLGRRLDVSMLGTIFSILETAVIEYTMADHIPGPVGNRDPGISPFDAFEAKDGSFVIACGTDRFWKALCQVMNKPELAEDPRFITNEKRCESYVEVLRPLLAEWFSQHSVDELQESITAAGIPFGKILNMKQVCEQKVLYENNMFWKVFDHGIKDEVQIPGTPIKFEGSMDDVRCSAPVLGEHSAEILKSALYYDDNMIEELKEKNII